MNITEKMVERALDRWADTSDGEGGLHRMRAALEAAFAAVAVIPGTDVFAAAGDDSNCPCVILGDPCSQACTCVDGFMSGGCLCCAKYGSEEQRREHAKWILRTLRAAAEKESEVMPPDTGAVPPLATSPGGAIAGASDLPDLPVWQHIKRSPSLDRSSMHVP